MGIYTNEIEKIDKRVEEIKKKSGGLEELVIVDSTGTVTEKSPFSQNAPQEQSQQSAESGS